MTERKFNPNARVNPKHHPSQARDVRWPEPGFFRTRLCRKCPLVAARITYEPTVDPETGKPQDERSLYWSALINGDPDHESAPFPNEMVMRVWMYGEFIDQAEHDLMVAQYRWDRQYAPDSPNANPRRPIDLAAVDPRSLFPRRTA